MRKVRSIPSIVQAESSECGLACLTMIGQAHGMGYSLRDLRTRFGASQRGLTLKDLIRQASAIGMSTRALRVNISHVKDLKRPCILHWNLNHYIVLTGVSGKRISILDPAVGARTLSPSEFSSHFTGIALELEPTAGITRATPPRRVSLKDLTGNIEGLKRSLVQIFLVAGALETFAVIAPLFNQLVIDHALTSEDHDLLTVLLCGFALLLAAQTAIGLARSWMVVTLSQNLSVQWMGNIFSHLLRLPIDFFERRHLGDITSRFGAINSIQRTVTTTAIESVLDGLLASVTLTMMLVYSPPLAAITLGSVAVYGLVRCIAYSTFRTATTERLVLAANENTHFLETLRAITPLKLFGREEERSTQWKSLVVNVQNRDAHIAQMNAGFNILNSFVFGLENLLIIWFGAKLIMNDMAAGSGNAAMTIGMLFAYIGYKTQFTSRVSALIGCIAEFKMLGLHAERLADICLEPPEKVDTPYSDLAHLDASIELRNVSFRYSENEPWILRNASFKIEAGENVAVVGASGAGKTTLLKIALGLVKPTEGEILFGGQQIKQLGIANFRHQVGTVMQEDVLLTGSLADNISFFDVQPDQSRVEACARIAHLHDEISRMPMRYNTLVGDLGSGLSGGQRQRLLLARALYKQPRVLALDEATSHLDIGNERAVTASLGQLALTRLIIAHRPETIAGAQRVVQIKDAQVVEVARTVPTSSARAPDAMSA